MGRVKIGHSLTSEVKITVCAGAESVDPVDTGIANEQGVGSVLWVEEADGVLFDVTVVDLSVVNSRVSRESRGYER